MAALSESMVWKSILLRLLDLGSAIGFEDLGGLFYEQQLLVWHSFRDTETYSGISQLLKNDMATPLLLLIAAVFGVYGYRVRQMIALPAMPHVVALIVCVLTQFGTSYFMAPSFQFIAGFALFPLFRRMRRVYPIALGSS